MINGSFSQSFILLGFSNQPYLELVLFAIILFFYLLTLLGNTSIILVSQLDPRLHTPMYFFVSHVSSLDLCFTTSVIPQVLVHLSRTDKSITFGGCAAQLYMSLALGSTECLLLTAMALDRFAAICYPLRYAIFMNPRLCRQLAAGSWVGGFMASLLQTVLTMKLSFCGRAQVDGFVCEVPALLKISCVDTTFIEVELFAATLLYLGVPVLLIFVSYGRIARAVLRIGSGEGRRKAFGTCESHLLVVSLFYGSILTVYILPHNRYAEARGKWLSLFYTVVTPTLNPLIYTLRNQDVKGAMRRLLVQKTVK
ncbi:olfactory receptor 2G6-like [Tachyglossus aculeatus]|uniref:olfactory receptor 2G6-like n=1 Tax=Tachyglossus aculeatus TaxID=9261 RepID=UPI0018F2A89D|nr:olfactory receptor 2G6-like [Tachyglossus aculeatus]